VKMLPIFAEIRHLLVIHLWHEPSTCCCCLFLCTFVITVAL